MEDLHWQQYTARFKVKPFDWHLQITDAPSLCLCIPVYAEPQLIRTLNSLAACTPLGTRTHVFILFNADQRMDPEEYANHQRIWNECLDWIASHNSQTIAFHAARYEAMQDKKWGVGSARKMCMDAAAKWLQQDGFMACLDGDCIVEENYFIEIEKWFNTDPKRTAASIYFAHDLRDLEEKHQLAIAAYELHLRYLEWGKRWAGHPYAGHTVGSSMAVRRSAYLAQGGMNTRQAGEDFYFLQKFIETEGWGMIQRTTVYPSSRISKKVPFGTGRAMENMLIYGQVLKTSHVESYAILKSFFGQLEAWYQQQLEKQQSATDAQILSDFDLPRPLAAFLVQIEFEKNVRQIIASTRGVKSFTKRFFRYFNSFMVIRYLHWMRDHGYPDMEVTTACTVLADSFGWNPPIDADEIALLTMYRDKDRSL